jgi:hypothetical protein
MSVDAIDGWEDPSTGPIGYHSLDDQGRPVGRGEPAVQRVDHERFVAI